jgi:hypothetical protein
MVEPTNLNPRRFSSLLIASEAMFAGTSPDCASYSVAAPSTKRQQSQSTHPAWPVFALITADCSFNLLRKREFCINSLFYAT